MGTGGATPACKRVCRRGCSVVAVSKRGRTRASKSLLSLLNKRVLPERQPVTVQASTRKVSSHCVHAFCEPCFCLPHMSGVRQVRLELTLS